MLSGNCEPIRLVSKSWQAPIPIHIYVPQKGWNNQSIHKVVNQRNNINLLLLVEVPCWIKFIDQTETTKTHQVIGSIKQIHQTCPNLPSSLLKFQEVFLGSRTRGRDAGQAQPTQGRVSWAIPRILGPWCRSWPPRGWSLRAVRHWCWWPPTCLPGSASRRVVSVVFKHYWWLISSWMWVNTIGRLIRMNLIVIKLNIINNSAD